MDRATDHLVTPPPVPDTAAPLSSRANDDCDRALHKQRVLDAARAIDPLKPLRRHPLITVATAAAIGVVAAAPAAVRTARLLPGGKLISNQAALGLARWLVNYLKEHRERAAATATVHDRTAPPAT